jgi:integrase
MTCDGQPAEEWVFPAGTKSGHIEKSTLKKKHPKAAKLAGLAPFPRYTFRHTCLTRWAAYMDPYTISPATATSPQRSDMFTHRHTRFEKRWNVPEQDRVGTVLGTLPKRRVILPRQPSR